MSNNDIKNLSTQIRKNVLKAILASKASHIASALSIVDILSVLYGKHFINPNEAQFILSKGHAGVALYATLYALNVISMEMFESYYKNGSYLGGHVSHKNVPCVYLSTGSLGGGVSVANGLCLANKINKKEKDVFVIVGDGECNEGSIWEACLFAGHSKLEYLTVIVDRNGLQGCGKTEDIMALNNLSNKFRAFNFEVFEIDGHDFTELENCFKSPKIKQPKCIIANTVKGAGISFMEHNNLWHYKNVIEDDYFKAITELESICYEQG